MNIAIVNNGTKEPEKLRALLASNTIENFTPENARLALEKPYDLIVLSGSSHMSVMNNLDLLEPEFSLIRETSSPLLGVCFGAELLTVAYGGTLRQDPHKEHGVYEIFVCVDDPIFQGRSAFEVYEAHRWATDTIPDELEVLAFSATGAEVIRHRTKLQYGFQFHPEKMCDETFGDELFNSFISRTLGSVPS